jgi:hypothetical protein
MAMGRFGQIRRCSHYTLGSTMTRSESAIMLTRLHGPGIRRGSSGRRRRADHTIP